MHEGVRRTRRPATFFNLQFSDGDCRLLCFDRNTCKPYQVVKTASSARGIRRLQAESAALLYLESVAPQLQVPRQVSWQSQLPEACLVETAVPGVPLGTHFRGGGIAALRPFLPTVCLWLDRFQALTRPATAESVVALFFQWRETNHAGLNNIPPLLPLLQCLESMTAHLQGGAVMVHGDFWSGNLLLQDEQLGVIDWNGLRLGTRWEDLLTFLLCALPAAPEPRLRAFQQCFFEDVEIACRLRNSAALGGAAAGELRFAFYFFLARRLFWEQGLDLQNRDSGEREQSLRQWTPLLSWIEDRQFPEPF